MTTAPEAYRFLRSNGWLTAASSALADAILTTGHLRALAPGDVICEGGSTGSVMCGIVSGQVGVRWYLGNFDSPFAHIGLPGSWWGAGPAWGQAREADVFARTPVEAITIEIRQLKEIAQSVPGAWRDLGLMAVDTAHLFASAHDDMMMRNARKRCIYVLLRLAGRRRRQLFPLPLAPVVMSHDELARVSNLSRSPVSNILHELEAKGLVELHYRSITVVDPDGLVKLAEDEWD